LSVLSQELCCGGGKLKRGKERLSPLFPSPNESRKKKNSRTIPETSMSLKKKNDKMVRFQVEISESYLNELKALQDLGGASSNKELLNNAIALLKWAVDQRQQGYTIAAVGVNGEIHDVLLPFLEHAASNGIKRHPHAVNA
jgi:hypothetical protein